MIKYKVHFMTPMGWLICNSAGEASPFSVDINEVTCKFCIERFSRPQYQKQLDQKYNKKTKKTK